MEKWVGFIAAISGVIIGATTSIVTTKLQIHQLDRIESKRVNIQKLEDLHMNISKLAASYQSIYISTKNKSNDFMKVELPIDKIKLLTGFYTPQLALDIDSLEKYQSVFLEIGQEIRLWQNSNLYPPMAPNK